MYGPARGIRVQDFKKVQVVPKSVSNFGKRINRLWSQINQQIEFCWIEKNLNFIFWNLIFKNQLKMDGIMKT